MHLPAVLAHPSFRRLWLSNTGSALGDRIVLAAMALYVTDLTGSPTDLGLVFGAQALPMVVLLLAGGVWADRLDRARLMAASDVVRGVLQAVVAVLVLTDAARVWHLVVIGLLFGAAEAFSRPAATGLLPQTVDEHQVQEARAVLSSSESAANIIGPAIGTALVVGIGAGVAFAADAATFFLSAAALIGIRARARGGTPVAGADKPASWRRELREGFDEVRSRVWVWATVLSATQFLMMSLAPLFVLGPAVAKAQYGSAGAFGVILVAFGTGSLTGGLVGLRWRPRRPLVVGLTLCAIWPCVGIALAFGAPRGVVYVIAAGGSFGTALFEIFWSTLLAQEIPPQALSRVSSFDWMGSLSLLPVGYALAGPIGAAFGEREVLVVFGILTVLTTLAGAFLPRETRALELREAAAV